VAKQTAESGKHEKFKEVSTMRTTKMLVAAVLCTGFMSTAAMAADEGQFSALEGIQAQALSSQEMAAIEGQIDLAGVITAINTKLASKPLLAAALVKYVNLLAARYPTLVDKYLAYLTAKYGI
jgi:UDP-N-acetylglucosamine enolpyruvyl transferase